MRSLARSLSREYGVGVADRVAVLSRNDTRVFEVLYACALLGAICVPLNWRLTASELTGIVDDAAPAVLVQESWAAPTVAAIAAGVVAAPHQVGWASDDGDPDTYEALTGRGAPADLEPAPVPRDAVWTIIYTSGTTGLPKGVQATHAGVLASMLGILVAHAVTASSRCLTVLPTFHVAGLTLHAHPVLFAGARSSSPAASTPRRHWTCSPTPAHR